MKTLAPRAAAPAAAAPSGKAVAPADNRPAAVAQRQLQATIAASPRQAPPVQLAAPRRNTTGLPDQLKAGVESLSGHSLDDVKVHYNSAKPAQLQALAYAQGTDIHIGPGQEKHLPHEAWHVVQQKQGRVRATRQLKGNVAINDEKGLESEATVMGAAAVQRISQPTTTGSATIAKKAHAETKTIQAIKIVDAFKTATPRRLPGRGAIATIDAALHTYITSPGANKLANAGNLIHVITSYVAGNHSAIRVAESNNLRIEARHEQGILNALGAANGALLEDLVTRTGGLVHHQALITLVNTITPAYAHYLPALINAAGGAGGLATLNTLIGVISVVNVPHLAGVILAVGGFVNHVHITDLAAEVGNANFANIPNYIQLAGGHAYIADLIDLLHRNPNDPAAASYFLAAVNTNAATFVRMSTALPHFAALAAPPAAPVAAPAVRALYPLPANLVADYQHFNERHTAATFLFTYRNIDMANGQTLWPYATTAADVQTYLETALIHIKGGVAGPPNPGATPNVPVGGGMDARIRINAPTGVTNYKISQFFPENGTPGSTHFTGLEMVGISKVLGHL